MQTPHIMANNRPANNSKIGPIIALNDGKRTNQSSVTVKFFRAQDRVGQPIIFKLPVYQSTNVKSAQLQQMATGPSSAVPSVKNANLTADESSGRQKKISTMLRRNSITGFANMQGSGKVKSYAVPVFSLPDTDTNSANQPSTSGFNVGDSSNRGPSRK